MLNFYRYFEYKIVEDPLMVLYIDPYFASFADYVEFHCAAGDISNYNGRVSNSKKVA